MVSWADDVVTLLDGSNVDSYETTTDPSLYKKHYGILCDILHIINALLLVSVQS